MLLSPPKKLIHFHLQKVYQRPISLPPLSRRFPGPFKLMTALHCVVLVIVVTKQGGPSPSILVAKELITLIN